MDAFGSVQVNGRVAGGCAGVAVWIVGDAIADDDDGAIVETITCNSVGIACATPAVGK